MGLLKTIGGVARIEPSLGQFAKGAQQKTRPEAGFEHTFEFDSVSDVDLLPAGAELHLDDAPTLLLDALLFSEPAVVWNPLGEEGVLQFALRPNLLRAGDAGGDFEQPHGAQLPRPEQM